MDIAVASLPESAQDMAPCCQIFDVQRLAGDRAPDQAMLLDDFSPSQAKCFFLRLGGDANPLSIRLVLEGAHGLIACGAGGWMLRPEQEGPAYWVPIQPRLRRLDRDGHILEESEAPLSGLDVSASGLAASFDIPEGWQLDCVVWRLEDPSLATELTQLSSIETAGYFSLGSHTAYRKPADLYAHLIHGWVYENRASWPKRWKICSENDAHALYIILSGLEKTTGKQLYGLLKRQLLLSVLSRQPEDGGFRHGEWTDSMEAHYRLHASAMHMMMDALAEHDDPTLHEALVRAARFLSNKRDDMRVGTWFIHDELELTEAGMDQAPFKWLPGRVLGKKPHTMLVINTHLDALIALDRYREISGDPQYATLVESGLAAAKAVLNLRPANWLYRSIFSAINLSFLPTEKAVRLPIWKRAWKRIGWKYFIPNLYRLKNRFPRLVMPGGYIDRHLALGSFAFHYLTVNLMDLVRTRRRFGGEGLDATLFEGLRFAQESGVRARWKELKYERYALGFWAEALWHACTVFPNPEHRAWLAEAILDLEAMGMGLPPSLIGVNGEATQAADCPNPLIPATRVTAWRGPEGVEALVVNCGLTAVTLRDAFAYPEGEWQDPTGVRVGPEHRIPAGGWVVGRA